MSNSYKKGKGSVILIVKWTILTRGAKEGGEVPHVKRKGGGTAPLSPRERKILLEKRGGLTT